VVKFNNGLMAKADLFQADWADAQIVHSGVAGPATAIISSRPERRLGARLLRDLRTVGNPDHGGADSGEAVFLRIANAGRELPLLPPGARCHLIARRCRRKVPML
jgi:hypothetical protein